MDLGPSGKWGPHTFASHSTARVFGQGKGWFLLTANTDGRRIGLGRTIAIGTGMILIPTILFMTATGTSSGRAGDPSPDPELTQRHRAVTESAVILAKTVLPQSVELMTTTAAAPAVAVPMVTVAPEPSVSRARAESSSRAESDGQEQGEATWYDYIEGTCAHVTLPMGTMVTVTRLSTGASTTCRVADRGPFGEGRVIDLEKDVFAELGDPSEGIFQVSLEW